MFSRRLKTGYFVLEGLNSFATTLYFYYFYFFMEKAFGFGNRANLSLAALSGFFYAAFSLLAGRFTERFGYFTALKIGFFIMLGSVTAGVLLGRAQGAVPWMIITMSLTVLGMCFTWPALEALVSSNEDRPGVQHMVGVYNIVWAGTGALAYFTGGAFLDTFGLNTLFYFPAAIVVVQLALVFWLETQCQPPIPAPPEQPAPVPLETSMHLPRRLRSFLRMAWLANPFAYIAINTLVAVVPGLARRFELSTMLAGFFCSLWCFARLGTFILLWYWTGWHYRFRWLLAAYLTLIITFTAILTVPNLTVLVCAQLLLGIALGLIYYSSLFYSMDLSDTKGEHGGIHEAAIGFGNFAGPAIGAAALALLPQYSNAAAFSVSGVLLLGLGGLLTLWRTGKTGT